MAILKRQSYQLATGNTDELSYEIYLNQTVPLRPSETMEERLEKLEKLRVQKHKEEVRQRREC